MGATDMTYFCKLLRVACVGGMVLGPLPALANTGDEAAKGAEAAALSPRAAAIRDEILSRYEPESAVDMFYAARGYEPVWLDAEGAPSTRATELVATLQDAGSHALPVARYDAAGLAAALSVIENPAKRTPAGIAAVEVELTRRFISYATDVSSGVLEPRSVSREIHVYPERPSPLALLQDAASAPDFGGYLDSLPPQTEEYARLRARYIEFLGIATTGDWSDPVPKGSTLRVGDRSDRVAALRERLVALGDFEAPAGADAASTGVTIVASTDPESGAAEAMAADPRLYDPALEMAVQRFQERHGLNVDGAVGPATLAALNASPVFRAQQIAVSLERMRWLNKELGERHVWVNQAAFMMKMVDKGEVIFTSRVVVGKARRHRTPEFNDQIEHMVINPTWYVPRSIATEEILPKLRNDPGYLAARGMRLSGGTDPWTVDWESVSPGSFGWSISQRPGRSNALGRVKFMFPNDFAIYLHDTPSRSLFKRDVRAFSHGCVRVEKPLEFAHILLAPQEEDPEGAFSAWLNRGSERRVNLDTPVPVYLTYRTAWVDENGVDQFRQDIYGRDTLVIKALRDAGVQLPSS